MGDQARRDTAAATDGTSSISGISTRGEATADLVWVCRSATLPSAQYRFYRALLLVFPVRGGPPDRTVLGQLAHRCGVDPEPALATLTTHDLVQRDPTTGTITAAYPFSGVPTPHRVTLLTEPDGFSGVQVYAMCALDALGIPLLLRRPALVTSDDPLTGEPVRIRLWEADGADASRGSAASGLPSWRTAWDPVTAVVYARPEHPTADTRDTREIASACRCPVTNFFTAPAHAHRWAEQHGASGDIVLPPAAALQRAERRFSGLLDRLAAVDGSGSMAD